MKLYVIDDEPDILNLVNIILLKHGYDVTLFNSGHSVLERIMVEKPDLLLLDMIMPELNGVDVIRELKKNPETSDIPIIVFSALARQDNIAEALEAGCDLYLKKPFVIDELLSAIRSLSGVSETLKL